MNITSSDYLAAKLAEARQRELHEEAAKSRLAESALKEIKPISLIRLPKFIKFGQN